MKTLKKILLGLLLSSIFFNTNAQNLVYNGGFEIYDTCPYSLNFFCGNLYLANWQCASLSPDYFNTCALVVSEVSVPNNFLGYQYPKNGNGYAGVASRDAQNTREFIQAKLDTALSIGKQYCVKLYISLGDTSFHAIDKFGAYFSDTAVIPYDNVNYPAPYLLTYTPQVQWMGGVITDTVNWIEVSGTFTAAGNENYITIGNFEYDSLTSFIVFNSLSGLPVNYYYLDDVSVEEVKTARAVNDTLLCVNADSVMIGINVTENASYSWQPSAGLSDANAPNPKAKPTVTTTYYVVKTQCSVLSTDSVTISIYDCTVYPLTIPTLITTNEYWELKHLEPNTQVWVYNSIGQLVFKESN